MCEIITEKEALEQIERVIDHWAVSAEIDVPVVLFDGMKKFAFSCGNIEIPLRESGDEPCGDVEMGRGAWTESRIYMSGHDLFLQIAGEYIDFPSNSIRGASKRTENSFELKLIDRSIDLRVSSTEQRDAWVNELNEIAAMSRPKVALDACIWQFDVSVPVSVKVMIRDYAHPILVFDESHLPLFAEWFANCFSRDAKTALWKRLTGADGKITTSDQIMPLLYESISTFVEMNHLRQNKDKLTAHILIPMTRWFIEEKECHFLFLSSFCNSFPFWIRQYRRDMTW